MRVPFETQLLKKRFTTKTQALKSRIGRYDDSGARFYMEKGLACKNLHILLVDDIITTGSTIENCYQVLRAIPDVKLSIATMAIAE